MTTEQAAAIFAPVTPNPAAYEGAPVAVWFGLVFVMVIVPMAIAFTINTFSNR